MTFIVADLERASAFFQDIFGAQEVYDSNGRPFSLSAEKFFLIGELWICIMEGAPLPEKTYNHIAFHVAEEEFDAYAARVKAAGVPVRPARPRVSGEGRSLYFYDFDNHLFELHTGSLGDRLEAYKARAR